MLTETRDRQQRTYQRRVPQKTMISSGCDRESARGWRLRSLLEHFGLWSRVLSKFVRHVVEPGGGQGDGHLAIAGVLPVPAVNPGERRRQGAEGRLPAVPLFEAFRVALRCAVRLRVK